MGRDPAGSKGRHVACDAEAVPEGGRLLVQLGEISVGIYNIDGEILAVRNYCPHAGAPICEGALCGAIVSEAPYERHLAYEGQILKCPWHGWEFKLPEGVTLTEPPARLRLYSVSIEEGKVIVHTDVRRSRRVTTPAGADA